MEIEKEFGFESAHWLPNVAEGHKCARMHGHSFRVVVRVDGPLDPELGWVMDFADLKTAVQPTIDALDHRELNQIDGLANPTSEVLATWIWERVVGTLSGLSSVTVRETCTSACTYRGD